MPTRAALTVRVSGQEQAERGTIETQIEFLRRYCALNDLQIIEVYRDEGVSGTIPFPQRPEGGRLMRDAARRKFDVVVSYKLDRIGRSVKVVYDALAELEALGIGYRSATEALDTTTPMGRMMLGLMAVFAQWERDLIRERCYEGKQRTARSGKWGGGPAPLGYRVEDGCLVVSEELVPGSIYSEAGVVRTIFRFLTEERRSIYWIVRWLNDHSILPPGRCRGWVKGADKWVHATLQSLVHNPVYCGKQVYGRHAITAEVPALITPEQWTAAQQQLLTNKKRSPRNRKQCYPLSGLIRCAVCGFVLSGYAVQKGRFRYYYQPASPGRTNELGFEQPPCKSHSLSAPKLEAQVWNDICEFVAHPDRALEKLIADLNARRVDEGQLQEAVDRLTSLIKGLEENRRRVHQLYIRQQISDERKDEELAKVDAEEQALLAQREEKTVELDAIRDQAGQVMTARQLLTAMQGKLESVTTLEEKQAIMQRAVREIWVWPDHVDVHYCFSPPDSILTEAFSVNSS